MKKILINICNLYNESEIAMILLDTLSKYYEIIFSFHDNNLAKLFYQKYNTCNIYISEYKYIILNGHYFDAFVTLGSVPIMRSTSLSRNLLIDFFDSINVPTIDIQHGFVQYGINKLDDGRKIGNREGESFSFGMSKSSKHQILWTGNDGIGYIKSSYEEKISCDDSLSIKFLKPYTLIITNYHSPTYCDADKRVLLKSLELLIAECKSTQFVWKPHPSEFSRIHEHFKDIVLEVNRCNIKNLKIVESDEISTSALIEGCDCVIATTSTALLSVEHKSKKALVFSCERNQEIINKYNKLTLFHNIKELRPLYKELKENMDLNFGRVDSGTGKFNPDKLISLVNNILSLSNNSYDTIEAINHLHKFAQYEGIIRELGESRKLNKLSKRSNGSKTIKNKIPDPKGLAVFSKIAFKNDIISIQELGLESCQDAPPHRHFDFTLHQIQIGYRKFPLLRLRMVEHNGRPGILIFLGESNHKPPLYHWKLSGEEGGYPYMLIIPQDELGQKYLVASTSSDIILIRESVRLFAGKLDATTEQGNAFQRKEWIRISRRFLELLDDIPPRLHYDDISTSYREEIYQFTLTNAWTSAKGFIPALELSWNNYIFDISTPTGASLPITNWPGDIIKMGARLSIDLNLKGNWDLQRVFWKSMTSNDRQFLLSIATELPNLIHHLVDRNPELKSNRETLDKQAKVVLSYAQALAIGRNPKRFLGLFNFWRNCK